MFFFKKLFDKIKKKEEKKNDGVTFGLETSSSYLIWIRFISIWRLFITFSTIPLVNVSVQLFFFSLLLSSAWS